MVRLFRFHCNTEKIRSPFDSLLKFLLLSLVVVVVIASVEATSLQSVVATSLQGGGEQKKRLESSSP